MKTPENSDGKPVKPTSTGVPASPKMRTLELWRSLRAEQRVHLVGAIMFVVAMVAFFAVPIAGVARDALRVDLHSHVVLIPFISIYLIRLKWHELPRTYQSSPGWAILPLAAGFIAYSAEWTRSAAGGLSRNDSMSLTAFAFVSLIVAGGFLFAGAAWMKRVAFPMAFLAFAIPLPDALVDHLETASKLASTEAADILFSAARAPVLRDGTIFRLPGIVLEVAQECSGIRSSYVLLITSLLISYLFLQSPWRRILLVAFVIPLGLIRNGFRILVIGLLCINYGPHMINSPVHHRGGPIFFGLSLVPLFLVLWWLRRGERARSRRAALD